VLKNDVANEYIDAMAFIYLSPWNNPLLGTFAIFRFRHEGTLQ
jgi:hypothetical protein